jgi:hypothetical protein
MHDLLQPLAIKLVIMYARGGSFTRQLKMGTFSHPPHWPHGQRQIIGQEIRKASTEEASLLNLFYKIPMRHRI